MYKLEFDTKSRRRSETAIQKKIKPYQYRYSGTYFLLFFFHLHINGGTQVWIFSQKIFYNKLTPVFETKKIEDS